jgi:hypothetical protein
MSLMIDLPMKFGTHKMDFSMCSGFMKIWTGLVFFLDTRYYICNRASQSLE